MVLLQMFTYKDADGTVLQTLAGGWDGTEAAFVSILHTKMMVYMIGLKSGKLELTMVAMVR